MKKAIFLLVLIIVFDSCRDVIFDNPFDPNASKIEVKILKIIDTTLSGNGDMCFDGEKLWFASENGSLYAINPESGTIIREISVGGTLSGITFFKGMLYVSLGFERTILIIDPLSGDVINERPMGDKIPSLITNDGTYLLIYDSKTQSMFTFDDDTGNFGFMFKLTGFQPSGLEYWEGKIVLVERNSLTLYLFKTDGSVEKSYSCPTNFPGGIARDNIDNFYLFSTDGKIYKILLF